jgi:hypothetical protein
MGWPSVIFYCVDARGVRIKWCFRGGGWRGRVRITCLEIEVMTRTFPSKDGEFIQWAKGFVKTYGEHDSKAIDTRDFSSDVKLGLPPRPSGHHVPFSCLSLHFLEGRGQLFIRIGRDEGFLGEDKEIFWGTREGWGVGCRGFGGGWWGRWRFRWIGGVECAGFILTRGTGDGRWKKGIFAGNE